MKVGILHLDLGIGGAEQLIVTIAVGLQDEGHEVQLFTTHHDIHHAFEETKPKGRLHDKIYIIGDWMPRQLYNKGTAFFAICRMIFLSLVVAVVHRNQIDVIIIDGVSASIPILKLAGFKVIMYSHFPDLLLCLNRRNFWRKFYRFIIDYIEEVSTGCADLILINSEYTKEVFNSTFKRIHNSPYSPSVLYPVVQSLNNICTTSSESSSISYTIGYDLVFVSLNRFERKKKIELALHAFKHFKTLLINQGDNRTALLVIAGGYDVNVTENVDYLQELIQICRKINMTLSCPLIQDKEGSDGRVDVVFRTSISSTERYHILNKANGLVYTPDREHFGIVPLEAMSVGTPVIAVNSGGPKETIVHGETGFLCNQDPIEFGETMWQLVQPHHLNKEENGLSSSLLCDYLGTFGQLRVKTHFSFEAMKVKLSSLIGIFNSANVESSKQLLNNAKRKFLMECVGWMILVVSVVFGLLYNTLYSRFDIWYNWIINK